MERLQQKAESRGEGVVTAEKFRVNVDDYPIFRQQYQKTENVDRNDDVRWQIDRTMSQYVTETAGLIAAIDGTAEKFEKNKNLEKPDHVIYLDKSARPVSWMVNMMWEDFSDGERPEHSYLNIDRNDWFRRVGLHPNEYGYVEMPNGEMERLKPADLVEAAERLPDELFAGLRALYVDGGVETEDPAEIMKMPTVLDGKNLLIVDEVGDTGSTLEIAKYIMKRAIPELNFVDGEYFWHPETKALRNGDKQRLSVPVWYKSDRTEGRGIGEIDEAYYGKKFEENPTPRNRARKLGAFALSSYVNLEKENGQLTRKLTKEMRQMKEDYEAGKVFLQKPLNWSKKRYAGVMMKQGVKFAPESDKSPNTYINIMKDIDGRLPEFEDRLAME